MHRVVNHSRPKQFNLDMGAIEKQYWSLQKLLHPDVFTTTSEVRGEENIVSPCLL